MPLETARRFMLAHNRRQHVAATSRWEHHIAYHAVWLKARGLSNLDQQPFLAVDPFDLVSERLDYTLFGLAAHLVDNLDKQVHQSIREFAFAIRQEKRIDSMASIIRNLCARGVDRELPQYFGHNAMRRTALQQALSRLTGRPPGIVAPPAKAR